MKTTSQKVFLITVIALSVAGILIFSSASLGILAKSESAFVSITLNQIVLGFVLGMIAFFIASYIPYKLWKKLAFYFFTISVILCGLVLVPHIGISRNNASRWIGFGNWSFQPSELLKISYVMYLSAFFSKGREKASTLKYGLKPYLIITVIVAVLLLLEPDNDTFFITAAAGLAIFIVAGAKMKHVALLFLVALLTVGGIVATRPYVRARIMTYLHPSEQSQTSSYQIQQSLIAIGSGGIFGKGFGQSTQKFGFLPEPFSDSIYAVASEEFGFLGSVTIVLLFVTFSLSGLKIASNSADMFGRLLAVGIVILIVSGSFSNIASMLGIIPLSGTPLLFISQGGTALLTGLAESGIILNISRNKKTR